VPSGCSCGCNCLFTRPVASDRLGHRRWRPPIGFAPEWWSGHGGCRESPPCPDHHTSGCLRPSPRRGRSAQMVTAPIAEEMGSAGQRVAASTGVWGGRRRVSMIAGRMAQGCRQPSGHSFDDGQISVRGCVAWLRCSGLICSTSRPLGCWRLVAGGCRVRWRDRRDRPPATSPRWRRDRRRSSMPGPTARPLALDLSGVRVQSRDHQADRGASMRVPMPCWAAPRDLLCANLRLCVPA